MAAEWVPDAPRVFNLGLRTRAVDHVAKTVTLELASDEALLTDYAPLADDASQVSATSLRAVVNHVLGLVIPGASLNATYWESWESDTLAGWAPYYADNYLTVTRGGYRSGVFGVYSFQTSFAGPHMASRAVGGLVVGHQYTLSAWASKAVQNVSDVKVGIDGGAFGSAVTITDYVWTKVTHTFTATATSHTLLLHASAPVVGQDGGTLWDDVALLDNTEPAADAPLTPDPDVLTWKAGTTAWDYLEPLTSAANLRLFCDELRVWRLVDPAEYQLPQYITVTPGNAVEGVDTISREDPMVFATGVVVRYVWTDGAGVAHDDFDSAGTPDKVARIVYNRPKPGPGAAAAILARRNGTGRIQEVSGLARWDASPAMTATVALPGVTVQLGKVTAVDWALDDSGLMRVGVSGLIDSVPGSWNDWPADEAWQDVPADVTWASL
jgi:hypothetical protein